MLTAKVPINLLCRWFA